MEQNAGLEAVGTQAYISQQKAEQRGIDDPHQLPMDKAEHQSLQQHRQPGGHGLPQPGKHQAPENQFFH